MLPSFSFPPRPLIELKGQRRVLPEKQEAECGCRRPPPQLRRGKARAGRLGSDASEQEPEGLRWSRPARSSSSGHERGGRGAPVPETTRGSLRQIWPAP